MKKPVLSNVLSKDQLKQITGGVVRQLTCWCINSPGGFSPHPDTSMPQLLAMINEYCGGEAHCSQVEV